jgi:hypothetical protein
VVDIHPILKFRIGSNGDIKIDVGALSNNTIGSDLYPFTYLSVVPYSGIGPDGGPR